MTNRVITVGRPIPPRTERAIALSPSTSPGSPRSESELGTEKTIFRETAAQLAASLRKAAVDHEAFERPMALCDLTKCRATCCHDGVILSDEEARILQNEGSGVVRQADGRHRTRTVVADREELVAENFPAHFPRTRCVFLDSEHRCHWQSRAVREGRFPWYYKPISCWMHPLILRTEDERPILTVLSQKEDKKRFASLTPCGRQAHEGVAAREVLRRELEMLGALSGRDFYRELNAPPGFSV